MVQAHHTDACFGVVSMTTNKNDQHGGNMNSNHTTLFHNLIQFMGLQDFGGGSAGFLVSSGMILSRFNR